GKYGCFSCHDIEGFEGRAPIGVELTAEGSKPVTQLGFGHEKIPHTREAWFAHHLQNPRRWDRGVVKSFKDLQLMPNFYLKEEEIEPMVTALLAQVSDKVPLKGQKILSASEAKSEMARHTLTRYNCMGCHQIDGERGDILPAYEDVNEAPPLLVGQGERVHSQWLYYFLDNVHVIRPWVKARMPSFELTVTEKNNIVDYFQHKSGMTSFSDIPEKIIWEAGEREAAVKLFNNLACVSCHSGGFNSYPQLGPNLHHSKMRLRPAWIEKWLKNPQKILEGTTMPAFWAEGPADPDLLGGSSDKQIKAVTKYVMEMSQNTYLKGLNKN
nr:c-type cytochrome [Bacteriovoracaceae bacterium]